MSDNFGKSDDATGKTLEFPLLQYTPDMNIEVNLTWDPAVIKTHEKIQFVYQFYDPQTNSNLAEMKYNFVIFQNGKEIFRDIRSKPNKRRLSEFCF